LFFLILVSLEGCFTTRNRCLRKYPPETSSDTIVRVVVRDSLVFRDTTIVVKLPSETIIDSIIIPCPPPISIPDTLTVRTEFAIAKAWYDGSLKLKLVQSGSFQIKLDSVIKESYEWRDKYEQILKKEVVTIKAKVHWIYKVAVGAWILVFILVLLSFLKFLKERYFPKILP